MTDPLAPQPDWRDRTTLRITIRPIWLAAVVSVLGHILVLWLGLPHLRLSLAEPKLPGAQQGKFDVVLAPPPRPLTPPPTPPAAAVEPPPAVKPAPRPRAAPPPAARRPPPAPPVIAMQPPAPATTPAPPPPAPPATRPPDTGDFASFVEARRRARAESQPQVTAAAPPGAPAESDVARANRNLAASIASQQPRDFGDPGKSGGIFSIQRMGLNDAEFVFYGWSFEARRNLSQLIEVKRGNNPTMQLAVVRKMIEIIRQYEKGDFQWESRRLGRWVTLSAAQRDTAGLESFLMQEFFQ